MRAERDRPNLPMEDLRGVFAGISLSLVIIVVLILGVWPRGSSAAEGASLDELRREALTLVNEARRENGLPTLEYSEPLNGAAQSHAEDMAERNYYSHISPEGETVRDRFLDAGGSDAKLAAENIAQCEDCPVPPGVERVRSFQQGWMDSPGHRENILKPGIDSFGFGIVGDGDVVFAVQTFAGAGTPPALAEGERDFSLSPGERAKAALEAVNRERARAESEPLEPSETLDMLAERLIAEEGAEDLMKSPDDLFGLLPQDDAEAWAELHVMAAGCGGCGSKAVAADIRYFTSQWLENPRYRDELKNGTGTHLGFAMTAGGDGRKVAVAVIGRRR